MENVEKIYEKMKEMFGDRIVDPEVFPQQFKYQAQLANYELFIDSQKEQNVKDV